MRRTAVLNLVGLTPSLIGEATPHLAAWAADGRLSTIDAATPAVTCAAQATYLTGTPPTTHGIVANGWYDRDDAEIKFWKQSNRLIQAPKLWEVARAADPSFTCAQHFWWYNMHAAVDWSVTPRPLYPADGRKLPDVYTQPMAMREALQAELGPFPLFEFWGPRASIRSSRWIAEAAMAVERAHAPTLSLVYLPHLDYGLQKWGPRDPRLRAELQAIDAVAGELIGFFESRGCQVVVLSEYGITEVSRHVPLNRHFRERGWIACREELGREVLIPGASPVFAVCDHQVAHVYVQDPARLAEARALLEALPGVERVLGGPERAEVGLDHPRAGELVAIAEADAWFSYYYWLDDARAPDFARTVDIHRKPGYDPAELFLDPALRFPMARVAKHLIKQRLGLRSLLEVVPLDPALVKGSHGRPTDRPEDGPLVITRQGELLPDRPLAATEVFGCLLAHLDPHLAAAPIVKSLLANRKI